MNSIRVRLVVGLLAVAGLVGLLTGFLLLSNTEQRLRGELRNGLLAELRLSAEDLVIELLPLGRNLGPQEEDDRPSIPPDRRQKRPEGSPQGFAEALRAARRRSPFGPLADRTEHLFIASSGTRRISSEELQGIELPAEPFPLVPVEFSDLNQSTVRFGPLDLPELGGEYLRLEAAFYAPRREPNASLRNPESTRANGRRRRPIRVSLLADSSFLREARSALISSMLLTGLIAALLSASLIYWVVTRSLEPLRGLRVQLDRLDADSLSRRVTLPKAPQELTPVVDEVNSLLQRMQFAFEREKAFLGDAAHELRTPIAGLRATLELARSRPRSSDEYHAVTGDCLGMALDMQRLVENLFELAQPFEREAQTSRQTLVLEDELQAAYAQLPQDSDTSVALQLNSQEFLHVLAGKVLLRTVLSNLLLNAAAHGSPAKESGAVEVEATLQRHESQVQLVLTNAADRLTEEDAERVFDPFWRADVARSHTGRHAGIGLALCRRAVEAMGGKIRASVDGGRFSVTIELPAAQ